MYDKWHSETRVTVQSSSQMLVECRLRKTKGLMLKFEAVDRSLLRAVVFSLHRIFKMCYVLNLVIPRANKHYI